MAWSTPSTDRVKNVNVNVNFNKRKGEDRAPMDLRERAVLKKTPTSPLKKTDVSPNA